MSWLNCIITSQDDYPSLSSHWNKKRGGSSPTVSENKYPTSPVVLFFLIRCWGKRQNQMIIRIGVHLAPKSNIVWPVLFFFLSRIYSENCTTILVYTLYQHCYIGKWILWCNNNKSLISEISKVPIMNIFVCHHVQM